MDILANIIAPSKELCLEENLYFRLINSSWYSYKDNKFYLKKGSEIIFDTYFNSFSIGKWKNYTSIEEVYLNIKGKGKYICYLYHINIDNTVTTIDIKEVENSTIIEVPSEIKDGIVFFKIKAINDVELDEIKWCTKNAQKKNIKLGISITTFNRQDAVKKSVNRILNFLHKNNQLNIHLVVVDNGKNVKLPSDSKLTLIPNENLGGSGGFARGLYYLKEENKDFTHCLFMDDDASCEVESIYRTYKLLEYAKDEKLAIAGAMFLHDRPFIQWENGAKFNKHCIPLKNMLDLSVWHNLMLNEIEEEFDYGGWWFFAFPIKYAEYPYPFFVRGDDVNFGLQKRFVQITMNGIGTWGDDFLYKESPLTKYLDTRNHLLNHLNVSFLKDDFITLFIIFWRPLIKFGFMYKYASVKAQNEALRDVLKGPEFFEKNIQMKEVFNKLKPLNEEEKPKEIDINSYKDFDKNLVFKWPWLMRILKITTLNGHLLPKLFFKKRGIILDKREHRIGAYFRRKKVLLYNFREKKGILLFHNKKRFFSLLIESIILSGKLVCNLSELRKKYRNAYSYLTSKEYWEKQFFKRQDI